MTVRPEPIRLLIADDEPIILEAYEAFLSELSAPLPAAPDGSIPPPPPEVELVCCGQAEEAVAEVTRSLEAGNPFALAFLDVNMPPGRDGVWAAEQIRSLDSAIEIVIVTAYSDISPLEITVRVPPAEKLLYLQKPFHPHEINQLVLSLSAKWSAQQGLRANMARLETAQHLAKFGHWEYDPHTRKAQWSEGMGRMLGVRAGHESGPIEMLWEHVDPHDRAQVLESVEREFQLGETRSLEYRIRLPEGTERTIQHEVVAIAGTSQDSLRLVGAALDLTERKRNEEQIRYLAYNDPLTGLRNRSFLTEHLPLVLNHANRNSSSAALLYVDLDYFKRVNDSMGHSAGDELLREVAARLEECVRDSDCVARTVHEDGTSPEFAALDGSDTIARMGGDEFIVLLTEVAEPDDPAHVAERIRQSLATPFQIGDKDIYISSSIGISAFPTDGADPESLLQKADAAMYSAKESGRNDFEFYTEALNAKVLDRVSREQALQRALDHDELILYYQPKVDSRDGTVVGAEALIRWQDPELGLVQPADFIPLAEQSGLIVPLGHWVMRSACAQVKRWERNGYAPIPVSINLSFRQFKDKKLIERIRDALEATGLDSGFLEVEFTESALMDDTVVSAVTLHELKKLGIRTAMDDFGTGYSSLSYLKRLPIDILKIDQSFVREVPSNKTDLAITRAIIEMAKELELEVICEGVERPEQMDALRQLGCHIIQGYLMGRPVAAREFAERHLVRTP